MNIQVCLQNLSKYNEGELLYTWLRLPASEEEINEALAEINVGVHTQNRLGVLLGAMEIDEEYMIADYEAPFKIHEYENIYELNARLADLEGLDTGVIESLCKSGYNFEEAVDIVKNESYIIWHDCDDMSDVAYAMVEEGYFGDIPENIAGYIDYEKLGRDISVDGTFVNTKEGIMIEITN